MSAAALARAASPGLSWLGILRLGLVQTALGAIVVLTTSTINRAMVVEMALPATLPGVLVGIHYAMQLLRPRMGHGADTGGRRTPWIIGGMAVLALGGAGAALATNLFAIGLLAGGIAAVIAFLLVGAGVGAAGTALLTLLAAEVAPQRRAAAGTIVWLMMIAGFALTATLAGRLLDPFSPQRLLAVCSGISFAAFLLAVVAVWGVESGARPPARREVPFRTALLHVWAEASARQFTIFVFVSMFAYATADLVLEPFAGEVFGLTIGQSTALAGQQHAGVAVGMVLVALAGSLGRGRFGSLRAWRVGGCIFSALVLAALAGARPGFPLALGFFLLGVGNGAFAAAAIATMMQLAGREGEERAGMRMGLWGAAQAIAFGLGGLMGTVLVDLGRLATGQAALAYALVFATEALLFLVSAILAYRVGAPARRALPEGAHA
ncbi:MAG: BCD family MFS transporter [Rhodovarius sp.]|nr:BCD family MFS transporter [Rhodovarius sp.]